MLGERAFPGTSTGGHAADSNPREAHLAALQPQWWKLWRRAAAPPVLSPAWLLPWWQVFHPGELHSVAVCDGPRLVVLALLYCERGRLLPLVRAGERPCASWDAAAYHLIKRPCASTRRQ